MEQHDIWYSQIVNALFDATLQLNRVPSISDARYRPFSRCMWSFLKRNSAPEAGAKALEIVLDL